MRRFWIQALSFTEAAYVTGCLFIIDEMGDSVTAIAREADENLWFVESHLR